MKKWSSTVALCLLAGFGASAGCSEDEDAAPQTGSPDHAGAICEEASDCYPGLDVSTLSGEVQCLDRVRGGYCTHLCQADSDCCALEGECKTALRQVCAPFESTGKTMCFLSCEAADLRAADGGVGAVDEQEYCQREASPDFVCRSSGGGGSNRKVCVPGNCGIGASCVADADCAAGLVCLTSVPGGYCTEADCAADVDCPKDSRCVGLQGRNYCLRSCMKDGNCSFCRSSAAPMHCSSDVAFVDPSVQGSVCVP